MGIDEAGKEGAILEENYVINFIARRHTRNFASIVADKRQLGMELAFCIDQIRQPSF